MIASPEAAGVINVTTAGRTIAVSAVLASLFVAPSAAQPVARRAVPRPVAVAGGAAAFSGPAALHITRARPVSFRSYYVMTDGGGYRWDFKYYGSIYRGTNNAFSGAMYCHVNGANFQTPNYAGWVNKTGDEIEMGPCSRSGLIVHRRIKVYKTLPLARWLDIFQNPSSAQITVSVRMYTRTSSTIKRTLTSTGRTSFGDKDFAFITQTTSTSAPLALHVVSSKGAKLRPSVQIQSNRIYVNYRLTVPPKKAVVLCHFESQNRSLLAHQKLMKSFPSGRLLGDLPGTMRQLIVNMRVLGGYAGVDLERMKRADTVIVHGAGPLYGTIANTSFTLQAIIGPLELPADRVIGMVTGTGRTVRFALADGQVITSEMPTETVNIELSTGGTLRIPFSRIRQWSYRISTARPAEVGFAGPYVRLRTGDHLLIDPTSPRLSFRTRHGRVDLDHKALLRVTMDNPNNAVHKAQFLNGSSLAGFVEPQVLNLKLRSGRMLKIRRDLVDEIAFGQEEKPGPALSGLRLTNEDELFGRLVVGDIELISEFGKVRVKPANIKAAAFSRQRVGFATLKLWDGSEVHGKVGTTPLAFQIIPGPTLRINPLQFTLLRRNRALPPAHVVAQARKLIKQLGHDDYTVRKTATETLMKMGKGIEPILAEHIKITEDPEIRQRLAELIGTPASGPPERQ